MSCNALAIVEVGREGIDGKQHSTIRTSSRFRLPDGWLIEEKPRPSKTHVDKYYYEPGTGRKFRSLLAVQRHLTGQTTKHHIEVPKTSARTSGKGERRACGVRSDRKPAHKRSSVTQEDKITPNFLKHSFQSALHEKPDSQKKDNRPSMHNLTVPPPAKVRWVLSGPGGVWNPFLDDSIIPESEKLKWSEAFVLSIHDDGVINGLNSRALQGSQHR